MDSGQIRAEINQTRRLIEETKVLIRKLEEKIDESRKMKRKFNDLISQHEYIQGRRIRTVKGIGDIGNITMSKKYSTGMLDLLSGAESGRISSLLNECLSEISQEGKKLENQLRQEERRLAELEARLAWLNRQWILAVEAESAEKHATAQGIFNQ